MDATPYKAVEMDSLDDVADESRDLGHGDLDPRADNDRRAARVARPVIEYRHEVGARDEDDETVLSDFLCDIRHLCDALGLDFDALDQRGYTHYYAEVRGG